MAMARKVQDARLSSAAARAKLKRQGGKPHYRSIIERPAAHLGYRRNRGSGVWVSRLYVGAGDYKVENIGPADDSLPANGTTIFSFDQAQEIVRARAQKMAAGAPSPNLTIGQAIDAYLVSRERDASRRDALAKLRNVGKELRAQSLEHLTEDALASWRETLSERMQQVSASRIAATFRACLNAAVRRHRAFLPAGFADIIRYGLAAPAGIVVRAREAQVLGEVEIRQILVSTAVVDEGAGWNGDLHRLILVLAATGARFSQIVRLRVCDAQLHERRLLVPSSLKGRRNTYVAVPIGDDVAAALSSVVAGRQGTEPLLMRPRWRRAGPGNWVKAGRAPWGVACELLRPWARIIAGAELPGDLVPYCLRHSSIVRGLKAGLPTRLVASGHDTSSNMIEKHYARHINDALSELARKAVVPLLPPSADSVVVPLRA
jgi:integrase